MKWSENNRVKDFKDLHVLATSFCNFHGEGFFVIAHNH